MAFVSTKYGIPDTEMWHFKKFTGKRILAELEEDPQESRCEWMLGRFRFAGIG